MPKLDNPRHEAFAQAIASGLKGAPAYRKVYGEKVRCPRQQAYDLLKDPDISLRVKEIQEGTEKGAVMTFQAKLEYLTKAITTPIDQIDETSPLCQRAKYSEAGRELWMVDKLRAMELLIKLLGEFAPEKVDMKGHVEHRHTVTEELRKNLIELRKESVVIHGGN